jgi:hypothetical protein
MMISSIYTCLEEPLSDDDVPLAEKLKHGFSKANSDQTHKNVKKSRTKSSSDTSDSDVPLVS